ncbi:MAG: hypothetical protein AAFV07_19735 [Bacteroidota bacterium]
MKEYTEIEIINAPQGVQALVAKEEILVFQFEEPALKRFLGGYPERLKGENLVTFSTQGYSTNLSCKLPVSGTALEIVSDWKREQKVADGIVRKKYFEKATKEDWEIKQFINGEKYRTHKVNITLSGEEKDYLSYGNTPLDMDDKWFSYMENDIIHFFRSWTGIEVFRAEIVQLDQQTWAIHEVHSIWDLEFMAGTNRKELSEILIKGQIQRMQHVFQ